MKISQKGSHVKLKKGDKMTIVPVHPKDLSKPLIKAIEKQTGEKII
ncbi:MAG: type II toxin-antitoxin system HicA family toxin [Oligoflexia bacterium]|nr:type II toxin-antitoxin system HicA family toxin [Oligoflexia bacterium]